MYLDHEPEITVKLDSRGPVGSDFCQLGSAEKKQRDDTTSQFVFCLPEASTGLLQSEDTVSREREEREREREAT